MAIFYNGKGQTASPFVPGLQVTARFLMMHDFWFGGFRAPINGIAMDEPIIGHFSHAFRVHPRSYLTQAISVENQARLILVNVPIESRYCTLRPYQHIVAPEISGE